MTAPAPTPPLVVRARLRLRWARRRARYAAARHLARVVALLDPPTEHIERARVADLALLGVPPLDRSTLSDRPELHVIRAALPPVPARREDTR